MRWRFPIAARLTSMLSAVALLTLLLSGLVQDRDLSRGIHDVAARRLEQASGAAGRLLERHLQTLAQRYVSVSRTPELRANLEVGHRATLERKAATLARQTGAELLLFLDARGRVQGRYGTKAAGETLRERWSARVEGSGAHCVAAADGGKLAEPQGLFRPCAGAVEPEATLVVGESGAQGVARIPLFTGKRRVGTLLAAEPLSEATLADWSELVGARIYHGTSGGSEPPERLVRSVRVFPEFELGIESSLAPELARLASARRSRVSAGLVALAIALALSAFLARDFTRPIHEIREVTLKVGEGELGARVNLLRRDEIGDVARVLDDTLDGLNESQRRLRSVQRIARFGDWSADLGRDRVEGSPEFERVMGLEAGGSRTLGAFLRCFVAEGRDQLDAAVDRCAKEGVPIEIDVRGRASHGQSRILHLTARRVSDGSAPGESLLLEGSVQDVTERRRAEEQIRFLAYHDTLTGLPNRRLLDERMALAMAPGQQKGFSLFFFDLDRFKLVNDTLGHSAGDELLAGVAKRLLATLSGQPESLLARFGGDEFTLLLPGVTEYEPVQTMAASLLSVVAQPFDLQGHETVVTSSVGIARWPTDGEGVEALLRSCDTALHRAKENGRNVYCVYDESMKQEANQRWQLENRLRQAIETPRFDVYYQPRVYAADRSLAGFEALLRWHDYGYKPDDFVPIAEETGLIVPLGAWVLGRVTEHMQGWAEGPLPPFHVSVNVSGRQLHPELVNTVRTAMEAHGIDPAMLEVEVTESALMDDAANGIEVLRQLRELGVRVFLDDFGTGYSSLSYLRTLPISGVKIDRSFVCSIATDQQDAALAASIVSMAKALNLAVVAEGVETEEQAEVLAELGCDEFQGFLFGEAAPAEDALRRLQETPTRKRLKQKA